MQVSLKGKYNFITKTVFRTKLSNRKLENEDFYKDLY